MCDFFCAIVALDFPTDRPSIRRTRPESCARCHRWHVHMYAYIYMYICEQLDHFSIKNQSNNEL